MDGADPPLSCPSAQPDMVDAHAFGIVSGTVQEPRIAYLKQDAEVTPEMMAQLGDLDPTRVFRFSARCESSPCPRFEDWPCGPGHAIAATPPPVWGALPPAGAVPLRRGGAGRLWERVAVFFGGADIVSGWVGL